jgi:hypothetical protein
LCDPSHTINKPRIKKLLIQTDRIIYKIYPGHQRPF